MQDKKYTKIQKVTDNPFLNFYHMDALSSTGKPFDYYFVSRNREDEIKIKSREMTPSGLAIYPIVKAQPDKIVMIKQYRYPIDAVIYELPAGLIEEGETEELAAVREMKEETGLDFEVYEGGDQCFRKSFLLGPGFTDESNATVFGYVSGEISDVMQEDTETIEVILVDKKEARRILMEERVSLRAAYLLMQFVHMDASAPFAFLD